MPTSRAPYSLLVLGRRALVGVVIALGAGALTAGDAEADIYQYTDPDGVVHFTNSPKGDDRFKLYVKSTSKRTKGARFSGTAVPPSDRSPERFTRYDKWIRQAATLYQLPEELVRAVIKVESDYDPRAVSGAGAQGLMQLMPETATRMQVRDPFDPRENIFGGVRYLRVLANLFNGDLDLTVAAYNAGEGAVARYGGVPPYPETQDYVVRVRTYYSAYRTNRDVGTASTIDVPFRPDL
ncbi:MAG: lytic transglycosylase domain-containing protein [Myxococcales bacterium]|nr:lytic transglycosylase domain-containing protein [Myxococcales bacterium]